MDRLSLLRKIVTASSFHTFGEAQLETQQTRAEVIQLAGSKRRSLKSTPPAQNLRCIFPRQPHASAHEASRAMFEKSHLAKFAKLPLNYKHKLVFLKTQFHIERAMGCKDVSIPQKLLIHSSNCYAKLLILTYFPGTTFRDLV